MLFTIGVYGRSEAQMLRLALNKEERKILLSRIQFDCISTESKHKSKATKSKMIGIITVVGVEA